MPLNDKKVWGILYVVSSYNHGATVNEYTLFGAVSFVYVKNARRRTLLLLCWEIEASFTNHWTRND